MKKDSTELYYVQPFANDMFGIIKKFETKSDKNKNSHVTKEQNLLYHNYKN